MRIAPTVQRRRAVTRRNGLATLIAASLLHVSITPASADDHVFGRPLHNNLRLDVCLTFAKDCGQPAALRFCNRVRYRGVSTFATEKVGPGDTTSVIGTGEVCHGASCVAFSSITCTGLFPFQQVFANPDFQGQRLDACLTFAKDCGMPAADAFCRSRRYANAFSAELDPVPGRSSTRVIGTGQVCQGSHCTGFQQIICE